MPPSALGVSRSTLKAEPGLKEPRRTGNCCLSLAPCAGSTSLPHQLSAAASRGWRVAAALAARPGCQARAVVLSTSPSALSHSLCNTRLAVSSPCPTRWCYRSGGAAGGGTQPGVVVGERRCWAGLPATLVIRFWAESSALP